MAQLQNLVLTDRAATPVDHTFVPADISQTGLGTVVESADTPIGDKRVQVAMNKTASGRYKGTLKMQIPVVQTETINGVSTPKVVRTAYVDLSVTFDPTSLLQERKDVIGMLQSALDSSKTLVNDSLVNLKSVY